MYTIRLIVPIRGGQFHQIAGSSKNPGKKSVIKIFFITFHYPVYTISCPKIFHKI